MYHAVDMQLWHVAFRFADRGGYTALVDTVVPSRSAFTLVFLWRLTYSCAREPFALLIEVDV